MAETITSETRVKLQAMWTAHWRHINASLPAVARDAGASREARIGWLCGLTGRRIESANELTEREAQNAVEQLRKSLPPGARRRKRPSRQQAHAYGTAGRRDGDRKSAQLVDATSLAALETALREAGWTREFLDHWLRTAPSSPLRRKNGGVIRTVADCNAVIWALRKISRHKSSTQRPQSPEAHA